MPPAWLNVKEIEELWVNEYQRALIIPLLVDPDLVMISVDVFIPFWPFQVDEEASIGDVSLLYYRPSPDKVLNKPVAGCEKVEIVGVRAGGVEHVISVRAWVLKRRLEPDKLSLIKSIVDRVCALAFKMRCGGSGEGLDSDTDVQ